MKKILSVSLLFIMILSVVCMPSKVQGATEKTNVTYYYTVMNGNKSGIYKMQMNGNKLVIKGTLAKAGTSKKAAEKYYDGQTLKYKRRIFQLSGKCKFYADGGDSGAEAYSRELFESNYVTQPNLGLGFRMKVKNGKVVAIYTES